MINLPSKLPPLTLDYEALFERLRAGHTLITGNSRLSRVLTDQYSQWRIKRGDNQWQSPVIVSWEIWLNSTWEAASLKGLAGTDRAVPGSRQLISLWESAIRETRITHNLLHPESLASQLRDTRRLVTEWQLSLNDPAWFADKNENFEAFYYWNKTFNSLCVEGNWIAPEDRTGLLCQAITELTLATPDAIDLLGFDEFNPGQTGLLLALLESGKAVCNLTITPAQKDAVLNKSEDSKTELEQMARWVRYWSEKEPGSNIAIVVPDLQTRQQTVERQLQEILTPGNRGDDLLARPWNISMGTPLARVPMIETAFALLKLLDDRVNIQDVGSVLRSPWLRGGVKERNSRAQLEKHLREKYPRQFKLKNVKYHSSETEKPDHQTDEPSEHECEPRVWNSPELTGVLARLMAFSRAYKGQHAPSAWAEAFDQLLVGVGWPLDEHDANGQALKAWRDALRELASLNATTPGLECKSAVNQLKQICREKIFQPHTPAARIQVLGLYEVSGLRFDHLWVVGLHNGNWPPSAKPNPFIPGSLQRAAQIPNSTPQRELEVARTITRRLVETAPNVVFSYPGQIDGEDVLPSPLLSAGITELKDDLPAWQGDSWLRAVANADKPQHDPLNMPGKLIYGRARGGSSILRYQALCPFRAFASNRLGADGLESPVDGISPWLHGNLVHKVLEYFWLETKTQAALLQLDDADLEKRLRKHVDNVVNEDLNLKQRPAFLGVEAKRLFRHVMDYLVLEKDRDSFEVIGFEKEILPEIEGQTIRLYIDRIDRLPSGEEIIIDYKTGTVDPKKWFGDRPDEPQLPLYAINADKTPAAVVFGIVREDGCEYKGVVRQDGLLPGLPPKATSSTQYLVDAGYEMPKTIQQWRKTLGHLMADFIAGEAHIDPKNGDKTCDNSYCKLKPLCRISELQQHQKALSETTA